MYVPITSEITIAIGTELREISTEQIFVVTDRIKGSPEISGEDVWRIIPIMSPGIERIALTLSRQELSQKYFVLESDIPVDH